MIHDPERTALMSRTKTGISLLLFLVTLAVYWQTGNHDFINYDDNLYVTDNPRVKSGLTWAGARWAFTATHAANWHPLTWLSHMADMQLYGMSAAGHHLTNAQLHAANGVLLFLLFHRMTGAIWRSALVAALFALHPLRVESVAWVAERKDVLSIFFALLTLLAYARHARRPSTKWYLLTLACFALGLMAKPMLVTLPCVMLLLDYWPLSRVQSGVACGNDDLTEGTPPLPIPGKRLLLEKLPFALLAGASCIITYYAQQSGQAVAAMELYPLLSRLGNALVAYVRYLGKMFWPVDLAVFYPLSESVPWWYPGAAALLIAITSCIIWQARRHPYLVTGWFWFMVTLVPVIGLVQVGMQAMADRYTYFPMIGIAIMLVWGGTGLAQRFAWRRSWCLAATTVVLTVITTMTWRQLHHWRSSYTLFNHAIAVTDNNFIAQTYLGAYHHSQKRYREAVQYYILSLTVKSGQADTHHNLGLALSNLGEYEEAVRHFQDALLILPTLVDTRYQLALAYGAQGKITDAVRQLELVILADPVHATGHYDLGVAYGRQGRHEQACQQFATALRLSPEMNAAREGVSICRTRWGMKL